MPKGAFITDKTLRDIITDSKPIPLSVKIKDRDLPITSSILSRYKEDNILLLSERIVSRIDSAIRDAGRESGKKKVESKKTSAQTYLSHDEKNPKTGASLGFGAGVKKLNVIKKLGSAMISGITAVLGEGTEEDPIVARYTTDFIIISKKSFAKDQSFKDQRSKPR